MVSTEKSPDALAGANGASYKLDSINYTISKNPRQGRLIDIALQLADAGLPVYPIYGNKAPACKRGFKDATSDHPAVRKLFNGNAATLIGVATGETSGIDVLDLDIPRHDEAAIWWTQHCFSLPSTRVHKSRSGGLHLLFWHSPGLRCSTARPVIGVDVRADGGGIIWWPANGCPILDMSPIAPWPGWLLQQILPPPRPVIVHPPCPSHFKDSYVRAAIDNAYNAIAGAPAGKRNSTLNAETWALLRFAEAGVISVQEVADIVANAALAAGLDDREIVRTISSAIRARRLA